MRPRDLVEAMAFEIVGIERRCGDQEGEAPEEVHQYTAGTYSASGTGVRW